MKSRARFSVLVVFAALLCLAPFAVGQGATVAGNSVFNHAPSAFLIVALGPGNFLDNNGDKGCRQGDNGGWDWFGGDKKDCKSTAVPEGGTSLIYLALAGLSCFGAIVYRTRRQASATGSN